MNSPDPVLMPGTVTSGPSWDDRFPAMSSEANFGRIAGLDGLRLLAVTIVLLRHFEVSTLIPGGLGVTVFFFISGFLITRLLLAEEAEAGRLDLPAFFVRRFVRLLPPLLLMGAVAIPLLVLFLPQRLDWMSALFNFAYLGNFYGIYEKLAGQATGPTAFGALWSLAVEEHFYLLLPLVFVFLKDIRARIWAVLALACVFPMLLRAIMLQTLPPDLADAVNYSFTLTRIDSIGWGVLLAMSLHAGWLDSLFSRRNGWFLLVGGAACTVLATLSWSENYAIAWRYTPQTIAIGCGVAAVTLAPGMGWLRGFLEWRPVAFFGRASYEVYLWHLPIFYLLAQYVPGRATVILLALVLTLSISAVCYLTTTRLSRDLRRTYGSRG